MQIEEYIIPWVKFHALVALKCAKSDKKPKVRQLAIQTKWNRKGKLPISLRSERLIDIAIEQKAQTKCHGKYDFSVLIKYPFIHTRAYGKCASNESETNIPRRHFRLLTSPWEMFAALPLQEAVRWTAFRIPPLSPPMSLCRSVLS